MLVSSWVERAQDRFGHWAVPNLIRILIGVNLATLLLSILSPGFVDILSLRPDAVMQGEVWRLVTFLFIPPAVENPVRGMIILIFFFWFLWWVGDALEDEIGPFQVNLFYLTSLLGVALATPFVHVAEIPNTYIHSALILMFGTLFPEVRILLYAILPIPAKLLAWIAGAGMAVMFFIVPDLRLVIAASVAGYLAFFGEALVRWTLRK